MDPNSEEEMQEQLLQERIVLLGTPVDDEVANRVVAQFLFLEEKSPTEDILFYVNSPGGSVSGCMTIFDVMRGPLRPDVVTICLGHGDGLAGMLVAGGTRGKRFSVRDATFQFVPLEVSGAGHPPESIQEDLDRLEAIIAESFANVLGCPSEQIVDAMRRRLQLDAKAALDIGMIDAIIDRDGPKAGSQ